MKRLTVLLVTALFVGAVTAQVKNIAVVETEIDVSSGASAELTAAEVRLVTAGLRREAVKNLPQQKYNIMTSETVYAQGGAVLEECADENCVITLGSKIGADYIVRGTISKIQKILTLSVEIYETEDGNLVASSDLVRSENIGDLIEKAAAVCADMYKTFANTRGSSRKAPATPVTDTVTAPPPNPPDSGALAAPKSAPQEHSSKRFSFSLGGGIFYSGDFGGGMYWTNNGDGDEILGMPSHAIGAHLFFDAVYAAVLIGYSQGGGKWKTPNNINPDSLPYMSRSSLNIGVLAKYPNLIEANPSFGDFESRMNIYPILGLDYEFSISGKLEFNNREYVFGDDNVNGDGGYYCNTDALSALWVKIGGGIDLYLAENTFLRLELLYGARFSNQFEMDNANIHKADTPRAGHGLTVRAGAGFKL